MEDTLKTIRLKFCGGCNPSYDRMARVQRIREHCGHRVRLVTEPDDDVVGVLVVAGCQTACVELTQFQGLPVLLVTDPQSAETICRKLLEFIIHPDYHRAFRDRY